MDKLLVIGGIAAGMSAASAFKRIKPDGKAYVFEKDYVASYGSCSLPYYISGDVSNVEDLISITTKSALEERGIEVFTRHEVSAIDSINQEITVKDFEGGEMKRFTYDKLIISTGAFPVKPTLPGIGLSNIFTLRTLLDGILIKNYIDQWTSFHVIQNPPWKRQNIFGITQRTMRAVIVGGGYIGMEMSESLSKRRLDVTVVEKTDRVLGNMDESIATIVEKQLISRGVTLLKKVSVLGFEGKNGMVTTVITDSGPIETDLVLLVIGVRPNTLIAQESGIHVGVTGAISVDDHLCTNLPNIFAAGDCAESIHLVTGHKVYIPLGTTANKQGRIAGENAAGENKVFEGIVGTAITKVFDLEVARTGLSSLEAERYGYDYLTSTITGKTRSSAYPAGKPITVTYVVDKSKGTLLGAQMVAEEGSAHRIDTLAACLHSKMTIAEVARLDLGYAPPFATVWDPILIAANESLKKLQKTS